MTLTSDLVSRTSIKSGGISFIFFEAGIPNFFGSVGRVFD